jgi:hypothetical protein
MGKDGRFHDVRIVQLPSQIQDHQRQSGSNFTAPTVSGDESSPPTRTSTPAERHAEVERARRVQEESASGRPDPGNPLHEAGHAVVAVLRGRALQWVTRSHCVYVPLHDAVVAVAGGVAEQLARRDVRGGGLSPGDRQIALEALRVQGKTEKWLGSAIQEASELLAAHWHCVTAVAGAIRRFGSLSGSEVHAIMLQAAAHARAADEEQRLYAMQQQTQRSELW